MSCSSNYLATRIPAVALYSDYWYRCIPTEACELYYLELTFTIVSGSFPYMSPDPVDPIVINMKIGDSLPVIYNTNNLGS